MIFFFNAIYAIKVHTNQEMRIGKKCQILLNRMKKPRNGRSNCKAKMPY